MTAMTDQTCVELHAAFQKYRQAKPWLTPNPQQPLNPQQPFTIQHPDTGEVACCCTVDDNTGEDRHDVGIAVYPGDVGLGTVTNLQLGAITLDDAGIEAYAVLNDSVVQALLRDPDHKSQPSRLNIQVPEDMTWPFWMIVSADATRTRPTAGTVLHDGIRSCPRPRRATARRLSKNTADAAGTRRRGSVHLRPVLQQGSKPVLVLPRRRQPDAHANDVPLNARVPRRHGPAVLTKSRRKTTRHLARSQLQTTAQQIFLPKGFRQKTFSKNEISQMKSVKGERQAVNVINLVTNSVHSAWHAAGEPINFEQAYSRGGCHFLVRVNRADGPWTTTVFGVSRQGDDPSADVVNFEQPLYDCVLEQSPGCDHPTSGKALPQSPRPNPNPNPNPTASPTLNFWTRPSGRS